MCSIKADLSPSCVYGRLVRSAASMAALTFSLASSETKWVPFAPRDQPRNKRDLSAPDRVVWDLFLLPLAKHKTFVVSSSSPVYMWAPLHPQLFSLADTSSGATGSQPVTLWRARQTQAWRGKHLTSVSAWEHLALPGLQGPSVCLPVWLWAYTHCVLVLSWHQNFILLHRYRFYIRRKQSPQHQNKHNNNNHSTILWLSNYWFNSLVCIFSTEAVMLFVKPHIPTNISYPPTK